MKSEEINNYNNNNNNNANYYSNREGDEELYSVPINFKQLISSPLPNPNPSFEIFDSIVPNAFPLPNIVPNLFSMNCIEPISVDQSEEKNLTAEMMMIDSTNNNTKMMMTKRRRSSSSSSLGESIEKRQIRMSKNRESAARSRARKQKVEKLSHMNEKLSNMNAILLQGEKEAEREEDWSVGRITKLSAPYTNFQPIPLLTNTKYSVFFFVKNSSLIFVPNIICLAHKRASGQHNVKL
ncbi:uncharacterized protein LOC133036317 isoform X2 [Cannabis sativa]|uniref:uncharacterized protein LOC133036317 isoform X2 n=1 Tax=Cannabis sativa TaxID=3483 RepID=UPI0029CA16C3|nr:uncharacterized protein LOC133036317 isoform X2 [Cannabis sativa]